MTALTFRQQVALRRRLRGDARRYLDALARHDASHAAWLGLMATLTIRDAIDAGWDAHEIGAAVGVVDPLAMFGLTDFEVPA